MTKQKSNTIEKNCERLGRTKTTFQEAANIFGLLVVILILFIGVTLLNIGNTNQAHLLAITNNTLHSQSSLLNLSVHTTLFNSSVLIAPAYNTTLCGIDGCANYTQGFNHTFTFNIINAGYLYITSSNAQNLTIIMTEAYKPPIPESHNNKYLSPIINKIAPSIWTTAILNTTFQNVVIPIVPGNATVILYNYGSIAYYSNIKIEYVK